MDDEPSIRKVLSAHLRRFGHDVQTANDGADAIARLEEEGFDLVVSDLKMPVVDGMELLRWVNTNQSAVPVILITAHGTVDSAVEAIKQGAFDYVTKPFDRDELQGAITKAIRTRARRQSHASDPEHTLIVGQTAEIEAVFKLVDKVAPSPTTVLVTGESGTGKELVARSIHEKSGRQGAFIQ
ncbi:MAG: response regulator, partial [Myxococcota bacterium]